MIIHLKIIQPGTNNLKVSNQICLLFWSSSKNTDIIFLGRSNSCTYLGEKEIVKSQEFIFSMKWLNANRMKYLHWHLSIHSYVTSKVTDGKDISEAQQRYFWEIAKIFLDTAKISFANIRNIGKTFKYIKPQLQRLIEIVLVLFWKWNLKSFFSLSLLRSTKDYVWKGAHKRKAYFQMCTSSKDIHITRH